MMALARDILTVWIYISNVMKKTCGLDVAELNSGTTPVVHREARHLEPPSGLLVSLP